MSATMTPPPGPLSPDPLASVLQEAPQPPWRHAPMIAAVLAAHVGAGWALMQVDSVRQAMHEVAPLMIDMIAPPPPPKPLPPPPPPPPAPPKRITPPKPAPIIAAPPAPSPAPAVFEAPPPPVEPPAVVAVNPPVEAPPPAPPAPAPQPKTVPASAVQYLVPPAPVYPRLSLRNRESGRVLLRLLIDDQGVPRQMSIQESSSYPRLDESAMAAAKSARFKPYTENGSAQPVWVLIPIVFDLEK